MKKILIILLSLSIAVALAGLASGCGGGSPGGEKQPTEPRGGGLTSDFEPCTGKSSDPKSYVGSLRLLTATSEDGLTFTRTNKILADQASVPDAVVLPSGRILVYYVAACKKQNGVESVVNEIVVALSDDGGATWIYKDVTFEGVPSGATDPVDPNVVLKPDGNLRLFTTIDPTPKGTRNPHTYSFISTDGGFTYTLEGERYAVSGVEILDPENYRFSDSNWQIWAGTRHATSTDGDSFTDLGPVVVATDDKGNPFIIAEIAETDTPGKWRMYVHCDMQCTDGIRSLVSTDAATWTLEDESRLVLDVGTGLESDGVKFPTVVRLADGKYLMVYQTMIP